VAAVKLACVANSLELLLAVDCIVVSGRLRCHQGPNDFFRTLTAKVLVYFSYFVPGESQYETVLVAVFRALAGNGVAVAFNCDRLRLGEGMQHVEMEPVWHERFERPDHADDLLTFIDARELAVVSRDSDGVRREACVDGLGISRSHRREKSDGHFFS
jgi:hypothetical protein